MGWWVEMMDAIDMTDAMDLGGALLIYAQCKLKRAEQQRIREFLGLESMGTMELNESDGEGALADRLKGGLAAVGVTDLSLPLGYIESLKGRLEILGMSVVTLLDPQYPKRLREIGDFPLALFYRGDISVLEDRRAIAIIGSRRPSYDGVRMCDDVTRHLAAGPITVISGLAYGIDAHAHYGALKYGCKTVAVLASGIDVLTPRSHQKLADKIVEQGGLLLSEYPPGYPALTHTYLYRNRLMSGLSNKVFVVEAALKSGSLWTARFALEQGRDLYVMPGSRSNPMAQGTNQLLRNGAISVIEPEDLEWIEGKVATRIFETDSLDLQGVYETLRSLGITTVEALAVKMKKPIYWVTSHVMQLTCDGWIEKVGDKIVLKSY